MKHLLFQYNTIEQHKGRNLHKTHQTDSGWDIRSGQRVTLYPRTTQTISTGLHIHIPLGLTGLIKSRSSLAIHHNVECSNAGVIDHGYHGEILLQLYNHGERDFSIDIGMRVAQLILVPSFATDLARLSRYSYPCKVPELDVNEWPESERSISGFGSTGIE